MLINFDKFVQFTKIQTEGSFEKISENLKEKFYKLLKTFSENFVQI